jgi:hypothetical protein
MIARNVIGALLLLSLPAYAEPIKAWPFKVYLDDKEIGHHHFELLQRDTEQEIRSRARFDVKLLFITAYRYQHDNVERWRGKCLSSLNSSTNDNGEQIDVRASTQAGLLRVQVNGKTAEYPVACPMSFAYWNPAFLRETQLLHPQTGDKVAVRITRTGTEPLKVGDQTVPSQHYTLRGPDLRIDLFYSEQGEWLALDAPTKNGRTLRYRLEHLPGCAKSSSDSNKREVCA